MFNSLDIPMEFIENSISIGIQIAETRVQTSNCVKIKIEGIDEWAVSDERLSIEQATERYEITYTPQAAGNGLIQVKRTK